MLIIVAHHYVINSGLIECINSQLTPTYKDYFLLLFGWGGKTAINCFVMITGYFMCKSRITVKKYIKLLAEVEFYKLAIFIIFWLSGYEPFTIKGMFKTVFPFFTIADGFTSCFLLFYLFIPFLNKLLLLLSEKEYISLIGICMFIYTVLPSFAKANVTFNYITWFCVVYIIAAYFRLYPHKWMDNTKIFVISTLIMLGLSWGSIILIRLIEQHFELSNGHEYFFVSDSNKVLAVLTAICAFLLFKNLKIKHNTFINAIASSTFGVLLLHANSDTMRRWLWNDAVHNVRFYETNMIIFHALVTVFSIYIICILIDQVRIKFVERPFILMIDKILSKKLMNNKK